MKYTHEIIINLPRNRVIELFDNPENMPKWQPELLSFKHESGTPGQPGAKSRLRYRMGKRELEMVETITVRNLPDEFTGTYDTKGVFNLVRNRFVELGPSKTRWICENEFRFQGMFMKFMAKLFPGMFKKQSYKFLEQFKAFAEKA